MTIPQSAPDLPDDWIVDLHAAVAADTQTNPLTTSLEGNHCQVTRVRSCLSLLEGLRQVNLASGGMIRELLQAPDGHTDAQDLDTTRIGRYEILEELGRGGHGIVLLAYDPTLKRQVALKVPRPEVLSSRQMRERFVREANAAARLTHPAIVQIYELGNSGPVCYIAAEFCPGKTLAASIRDSGPFRDSKSAASVLLALAEAVDYAYARGVLHRDLKPANVLLVPVDKRLISTDCGADVRANACEPKLTDFGLAKLVDVEPDYTRTGVLLGTPAYMAPEQAQGQAHGLDPRTDVYGLGTILYEMLAGRPPFVGASDLEILRQVAEEEPTPLIKLRPAVSPDLAAICHKCLEKSPTARYATAAQLAADLRRFLAGEPTTARPATKLQRARKWIRRYPMAAALIGVSTVAVVLISIGALVAFDRAAAAISSDRRSTRLIYTSTMAQAWNAWENDSVDAVVRLLERCRPAPGQEDLREFSWHCLWNLTHQYEQTLTGHAGQVYRAVFSPDGKRLASCGQDNTIRIWDAATGRLLHTLKGTNAEANGVAFSPDNETVASAWDDGSVRIWSASTGARRYSLNGHHGKPVTAIAFSPDGGVLATGGADARIMLWNTDTWSERHALAYHSDDVESLAFSPDGSLLASASDDKQIRLWHTSEGNLVGTLVPRTGVASCLAFSDDGQRLATAGRSDPTVLVWNLATQTEESSVGNSYGGVHSLVFLGDQKLACAGRDGTIRLVDVQQMTSIKLLGHRDRVWSVAASSDRKRLVSTGEDGTIRLWNLERTFADRTIGDAMPLKCVAYAANGSLGFGGTDPFSLQRLNPSQDHEAKAILAVSPMSGDFDNDGLNDRCWFDKGHWIIAFAARPPVAPVEVSFGLAGDRPVVGDWNGDGKDDLGIFRQGRFLLRLIATPTENFREVVLGGPTSLPLVADWNGDGRDELGVVENDQVLVDLDLTGRPEDLRTTLPSVGNKLRLQPIAKAGELDHTFASSGVFAPTWPLSSEGIAIAIERDAKITVGYNVHILPPEGPGVGLGILRLNAGGMVDSGFQPGEFEIGSRESHKSCEDLALQPDGKSLVLHGVWDHGSGYTAISRRLADGSIDQEFGTDKTGTVRGDFGTGSRAFSLAIQGDGKIVTAGYVWRTGSPNSQIAIARRNSDGSLDPTFGADRSGMVITDLGPGGGQVRSVRVLPDGKIMVAGFFGIPNSYRGVLLRYEMDGSLDKSFGPANTGIAATEIDRVHALDVALDSSGNAYVVGNIVIGETSALLTKFDVQGRHDTSFGSNGWVTLPLSRKDDNLTQVAVDKQGRVVVSGYSGLDRDSQLLLLRFLPDGTLETDFRPAIQQHPSFASGVHSIQGLAIDDLDRPVITGRVKAAHHFDLIVCRFLSESSDRSAEPASDSIAPSGLDLRRLEQLITPELLCRARSEFCAAPPSINHLAVSPQGQLVATNANSGNDVRIVDMVTGCEIKVLRGHQAEVFAIVFSPDGRFLATAGWDSQIRIWDCSTWNELAVLKSRSLPIECLSFSPDGKLLASTAEDGTRIWQMSDRTVLRELPTQRGVLGIAFSGDGRQLAICGDRLIKLWDAATGEIIATLTGHTARVRAVSYSPDGRTLASCGLDGTIRLWDLLTYQELAVVRDQPGQVFALAFSPDGRELASVSGTPQGRGELRIRSMMQPILAQ